MNELKPFQYQGHIHLITQSSDIPLAVQKLKQEALLGFDTETRPAFRKGESYLPSLLQLSSESESYLFRLHQTGFASELIDLLEDPQIIKAGVAIHDDLIGLKKIKTFTPQGFVEIATMAKAQGHERLGLRNLSAELLELQVSKKTRTTNWARETLTQTQLQYAAGDSYLSLKLYQKLKTLERA